MVADVKKTNPFRCLAKLSGNLLYRFAIARAQQVYINYWDFFNCNRFGGCVAHRNVELGFKLLENDFVDSIVELIFDD